MTQYLVVNPEHPEPDLIAAAAAVIRSGGTVAFPTETVYGLGANGLDPAAVEQIYIAKGRPLRNPLILHVASVEQARRLVSVWPPEAQRLADRFWPGPLTLILPRSTQRVPGAAPAPAGHGARLVAPDIVTAGLPGVALRIPAHPVALALIEQSDLPVAAPSANSSGCPSPTLAEHVRADLDGRIDLVLDGGPTPVGVESTILDLSGELPVLLRPGGVTREELEQVLGTVLAYDTATTGVPAAAEEMGGEAVAPCPGTLFRHYAPKAETIVVIGSPGEQSAKISSYLAAHPGIRVGLLATAENAPAYQALGVNASRPEAVPATTVHMEILGPRQQPEVIASRIFSALRNCDTAGAEVILVEAIPLSGIGFAVMNRVYRAARNRTL